MHPFDDHKPRLGGAAVKRRDAHAYAFTTSRLYTVARSYPRTILNRSFVPSFRHFSLSLFPFSLLLISFVPFVPIESRPNISSRKDLDIELCE